MAPRTNPPAEFDFAGEPTCVTAVDAASTISSAPAPLPVARLNHAERIACLRLIRSDSVGPVTFRQLINHFGGAEAAIAALPELSRKVGRKKPITVIPAAVAEAELEAAARVGAEPVFTIEPGYPYRLAVTHAPPPLLYIKGRRDIFDAPAVGIVGSRQCSASGVKVCEHFARALSEAGYVIASGLARGIDGHAHRASLARGTVAVVAGGVDVVYPPEHASLHAAICEQGAVISEKPPGYKPRGEDFVPRNRIISGVSLGVLIVEAAARSGTLSTARFAREQDREVFAIPGHPLDPRAEGTNALIKDQKAKFTTSPQDILDELRPMTGFAEHGEALAQRLIAQMQPATPPENMSDDSADNAREVVFAALGPAPCDVDSLQRATGLSIRAVNIAVLELTLAERITHPGPGLLARTV